MWHLMAKYSCRQFKLHDTSRLAKVNTPNESGKSWQKRHHCGQAEHGADQDAEQCFDKKYRANPLQAPLLRTMH